MGEAAPFWRSAALLLGLALVLETALVVSVEIERPTALASLPMEVRRLSVAAPDWVGTARRGRVMPFPSTALCKVATDLRHGQLPVQPRTGAPIRLEGLVVLTDDGVCPLYEKALAADTLGAEGVLTQLPDPKYKPDGMLGYIEMDPPLDLPVEIVSRNAYDALASAVAEWGSEVIVHIGRSLDVVRYF